jgi:phage terminase small subunit
VAKREQLDDDGLTPKMRAFCLELVASRDLNQSEAAKRAGYSARSAASIAHELMAKPAVKAFLEPRLRNRQAKLERRLDLRADRLDEELARICYFDPAKLVDDKGNAIGLHNLDEDTRRALGKVKFRVAKVIRGAKAAGAAAQIGFNPGGQADDGAEVPPVEELTIGTLELSPSPKVEALNLANRVLGRLKDRVEVTAKLSHEQLLVLAQKIRAKKLAARAAVGGMPSPPARGGSR